MGAGTNLQKIAVSFIVTAAVAIVLESFCGVIRKHIVNIVEKSYMR